MKKKRGRPSTFERGRTIELAMDQYWSEGLHALSINEVCRRTGVSKPALYRQLGGEDGLLDSVLEHYHETVISPMASLLLPDRTYAENSATLIGFISAASDAPGGCLLVKMRGAPDRLGPRTTARVEAMVREIRGVYEAVIVAAINRSEVRSDISPQVGAQYLDAQLTGALRQVGAGENPDEVCVLAGLAFNALMTR